MVNFDKLMENGETGKNGQNAQRHVDLGKEAGQGTVTTQLQLMEAETVRDPARSLKFVTQILVQVTNVGIGTTGTGTNVSLTQFYVICTCGFVVDRIHFMIY